MFNHHLTVGDQLFFAAHVFSPLEDHLSVNHRVGGTLTSSCEPSHFFCDYSCLHICLPSTRDIETGYSDDHCLDRAVGSLVYQMSENCGKLLHSFPMRRLHIVFSNQQARSQVYIINLQLID